MKQEGQKRAKKAKRYFLPFFALLAVFASLSELPAQVLFFPSFHLSIPAAARSIW
jgi:hypothetical protein